MNVSFLGFGAVGNVFASLFVDNGMKVNVLCDDIRYKKYVENGFYVNEKLYPFHYVNTNTSSDLIDFLFIATKDHHFETAIVNIGHLLHPNTIVFSLLNGTTSEERFKRVYPNVKLVYSFVLGTDATKANNRTTFNKKGKICFGEENNQHTEVSQKIIDLFEQYDIGYIQPKDIYYEIWWKYMMNIGINQTTALFQLDYIAFMKHEEAIQIARNAMHEVQKIASKLGVPLTVSDIDRVIDAIAGLKTKGKTSMYQDVYEKRKTELDMLAGTVITLGKQLNIKTPTNEFLYDELKKIERNYLEK